MKRTHPGEFEILGSCYREGGSILVLEGMQIDNLSFGVSFDLNTRDFAFNDPDSNNLPTYEISLTCTLDLSNLQKEHF